MTTRGGRGRRRMERIGFTAPQSDRRPDRLASKMRAGVYPDAPSPPCTVGYEVAGEVESVGDGVDGFAVGDRVIAGTVFNGHAELVAVPADQVIALPHRLSFE